VVQLGSAFKPGVELGLLGGAVFEVFQEILDGMADGGKLIRQEIVEVVIILLAVDECLVI
jgi:hypothetical protein